MIDKKGFVGLMKGTAGLVLAAVFVLAVILFFTVPIFATHSITATVTPTTADQSQSVTLNFTITPSGGNLTNVTINFTAAGWTLPSDNTTIDCPTVNGSIWFADLPAGGGVRCYNASVTSVATSAVFIAVLSTTSPASAGTKSFVINSTDSTAGQANASVDVSVLALSANMTVNDTLAQINSQKSYRFTIFNNGTDEISRIYIGYTNWTNDTVAGNVTCPTIGGAWTKSVDTTNDRIGCYADAGQTNLAAGASTTIDVSNWVAINAGGRKLFALTATGNAGGNYTETLNNPNVTVFGTASTTIIDNSTSPQPISRNLVDVLRINITATGEQINVTSININLSGSVQEADIQSVMIWNETTTLGSAQMIHIATNGTRLGTAGGNVTITFSAPGWIIPANSSNITRVVLNISTAATGGRTYTGTITAAANISMEGFQSGRQINTSGTFPATATNVTIIGNLSLNTTNTVVAGNTLIQNGAVNFTTLHINLTAQGEQMNSVTLFINTSATQLNDISSMMVYNDTDCNSGSNVVSADKLINATSAAPTATQAIRLGNATFNETVPAGTTRCYFVAYNITRGAAGGNTITTLLAANNATATGASSSQTITSYGANGQTSVAAEIVGNVSIAFFNKAVASKLAGTAIYIVGVLNITANNENLTSIRLALDTTGNGNTSLQDVKIIQDNNTDQAYTAGTDIVLNTTASVTGTIFFVNLTRNETIGNGSTGTYLIAYNISPTATAGNVFTTTIGATNVTAVGGVSNETLTSYGTNTNATLTTIVNVSVQFADKVVSGNTIAPVGVANFTTAMLNITPTGEAIKNIDVAFNSTVTAAGDIGAVILYKDNNCGGTIDSGDRVLNTTTTTGTVVMRLGNATYNETVASASTNCYLFAYNISATANGGDTLTTTLAGNNVTALGNTTNENFTSYGANSLTSTAAEIQGNLTAGITNRAPSTVVIGTTNLSVLQVNLTALGENMTSIRLIVDTTGNGNTSVNGVMIARDNNTNGAYDGQGTDTILNTTGSVTGTIFFVNLSANETIAANTNRSYLILYNITASGGGNVFTSTLAITNITATSGVSNNTVTASNVSHASAVNSSLVKVFGNFSVDGFNLTASRVNTNQTSVPIFKLNYTATGEIVTIQQINVTMNLTSNTDVTSARLMNDTNNNSVVDAGEPVVATATLSGNVARFGTTGTTLFNVPSGSVIGMILVYDINESAAGLNAIDGHIAAAANITAVGNSSAESLTVLGTFSIDPAGSATVRPLSAVGNLSVTTVPINSQTTFTIIVNNTAGDFAGDRISEIMINYTSAMNDSIAGNITCPTILGVTWNRTLDTTNDLIFCNSTGPNNILNPGNTTNPNATITVSNWVAPGTAGNNTLRLIVRGNGGNGTKNVSVIPTIATYGTLTMAFADKATSTVQINSTNYALAMINLTPTGESMNNPVFSLNLTSVSGNVTALTIFNNTGCDGSTQGAVVGVNTTTAALNGTASTTANVTIAPGQNTCFIVAVNVSGGAIGGNTITLAMAANNVSATGLSSSVRNITTTGNNSLTSTAAEIYGNVTIAATNLASGLIGASRDGFVFLQLNITAGGENLNITAINVTLGGNATGGNTSATNGTLIYNDTNNNNAFNFGTDLNFSAANGTFANTAGASLNLSFTGNFTVPAGTTRQIFIVFNTSSTVQHNAIIGATIARANNIHMAGGTSGIEINPLSGVPIASTNVTIDAVAPSVSVSAPTNSTVVNSSVELIYTASDNVTITCVRELDGTNTTIASCANQTMTSLAIGAHNVAVFVNDTVNNTNVSRVTFTVDQIAPVVTLIAPTNSTVVNSSVELIFTAPDNGTVTCVRQLDGTNTSIASCANTTMTSLATGAHTVKVFANDTLNNTGVSSAITFTVDQIAPVVTINSPTNITTNVQNQSLNFVAPDNATVTCVMQNNTANFSLSSCGNITFLAAVGANTVKVFANDTLNNTGVASVGFTYDNQGPVITITSPTNTTFNSTSVALTYTSSDSTGTPLQCVRELDGTNTTIASCANQTMTGLATGAHTVKVFSNDTGNNTNVSSVSFTVDQIGPTVTLVAPTNSTVVNSSVQLIFTVTDNATDTCVRQLDGTNTTIDSCANSTMTSLATGAHTIKIFANDSTNNTASTSLITFTVDQIAPVVTLIAPTNSTVVNSSVELIFTAPDNGTVTCVRQLDGTNTSIASCANTTMTSLATGAHTVKVFANDTLNNTGVSSAITFTVDQIAPVVTINSPTNITTNVQNQSLNFVAPDNATVTCVMQNNTANFSLSSCGNITFLAAVGANTVKVFANDTLNNTGVASVVFTYDNQGPVITITSPLNTSYNTTNITLTFTSSDSTGTPLQCVRELNGTNSSISSCENQTFTAGVGNNTLKVFSNDTGNNTNVSSVGFTIDLSIPIVVNSSPNGTITAASVSLNVTTNENSTCRYDTVDRDYYTMANNMTGAATAHNATVSGLVNATTYTFQVRCQDTAGNAMTTSSVITFTTNITSDITAPNAPGNLTAVQVAGTRQVNLTWSASGSSDAVQYRVYRALNAAVTVNSSLVTSLGNVTKYSDLVPADGTWNYTVTAVDTSNNEGSAATAAAVTIDTLAPEIVDTAPSAGAALSSSTVLLRVNTSEAASCRFDTSDKAYQNMSTTMNGSSLNHTYNLTGLSDGVHARYVRCSDSSGNNMSASSVIWFSINTTGNFNYTQSLNKGWNTLFIPQTGVLTTMGYNSSNTQNWNISYILNLSLAGNYTLVYYNTDGTGSGWKSFNATDWAGSDLKYINNTNDKPYWINTTVAERFEL